LWKLRAKPEGRIAYMLLALGLTLCVIAIYYSHHVASVLGFTLIFWGALLMYLSPIQLVRKEVMDYTISDYNGNLSRIIEELGYKGYPLHISPGTLWGMNNTILWISKDNITVRPSDEQLSSEELFLDDPKGIVISPPGQGLMRLMEDEINSFTTMGFDELSLNLQRVLVEGLEVAESLEFVREDQMIKLTTKGIILLDLIQKNAKNPLNMRIGDPYNSAIASTLARSTRTPVLIESVEIDSKNEIVTTIFKIHSEMLEKNDNY
jgi:hypothetical protein